MLLNQKKRYSTPKDCQNSAQGSSGDTTEDTTAWHLYNNHAGEMEIERVQDWKDTLNTLLVFAALYSAILTAFIIESMKLIREDNSETTKNILISISKQLNDTSAPFYDETIHEFVAPLWAIRVNFCFFVSLACSLATALAAVLALQWVGSYDHGLNPSSIEGRAIQLRFRIHGAERWKLDQVIAFMPTIIFFSLLIFMAGLGVWLRNIHSLVAIVIILGAAIGTVFFGITTLISIFDVAAPFRTPVSRYLPKTTAKVIHRVLTGAAVGFKPVRNLIIYVKQVFRAKDIMIANQIVPMTTKTAHKSAPTIITAVTPTTANTTNSRMLHPPRWGRFQEFLRSFDFIIPIEERERKAIDSKKDFLEPSSLFWLAESLYIESYQRRNITIVVQAILDLPRWQRLRDKSKVNLSAWTLIIKELHSPLSGKMYWTSYSTEDLKQATLFMQCLASIGSGVFEEGDFLLLVGSFYGAYPEFVRISGLLVSWRRLELLSMEREKKEQSKSITLVDTQNTIVDNTQQHVTVEMESGTLLDIYQQVIQYWFELPLEFVILTLESIQEESQLLKWKNFDVFDPISSHLLIDYHKSSDEDTMPLQTLELLQGIITSQLSMPPLPRLDLESYLNALWHYLDLSHNENGDFITYENPTVNESDTKGAKLAHIAIVQQTIARLALFRASSVSDGPQIQDIIHRIYQIVHHPTWEEISNTQALPSLGDSVQPLQPLSPLSRSLLISMTNTKFTIWDKQNCSETATILLTALFRKEDFGNWAVWWVEFIIALQNLIDGEKNDKDRNEQETWSIVVKLGCKALDANLVEATSFLPEHIERLQHCKILKILFLISRSTRAQNPYIEK